VKKETGRNHTTEKGCWGGKKKKEESSTPPFSLFPPLDCTADTLGEKRKEKGEKRRPEDSQRKKERGRGHDMG